MSTDRAYPSKCGSVITSRLVTYLDRDVEILDSEAFGHDWQDLLTKQMYPLLQQRPEKLAFGSGFEIAKIALTRRVD